MTRALYVAPRFARWGELFEGTRVVHPRPGCPGVMLVFDSVEALMAEYPNVDTASIIVILAPDVEEG